jgi:hypothetical protein
VCLRSLSTDVACFAANLLLPRTLSFVFSECLTEVCPTEWTLYWAEALLIVVENSFRCKKWK